MGESVIRLVPATRDLRGGVEKPFFVDAEHFFRCNRKELTQVKVKCKRGRGKQKYGVYLEFEEIGITLFVEGSRIRFEDSPALIPNT